MKKTIVVLVVLFVASVVLGYYFLPFDRGEGLHEVTAYSFVGPIGTYEFIKSEEGDHWLDWSLRTRKDGNIYLVQDYKTPFAYGPKELLDIPMIDSRDLITSADRVYITRDANLDDKYHEVYPKGGVVISLYNIERILYRYQIDTVFAATEENDASLERELSIVDCRAANSREVVIMFKEGDENRIYREGDYCIIAEFVEGDDPNKLATKIVYNVIGVM